MSNQSEKTPKTTPKTKNFQKVKEITSSKTLRDWRKLDTSITLSPSPQDNALQFHMSIPIELSASLNLKQQDFLHNLLETKMNISKAAEMSGISESYGRKITQMPNARAYLSALRNQRSAIEIMSYTELLSELSAIARGNETDDFVNAKTDKVTEVRTPSNVRVQAMQILAKWHKVLFDGPTNQNLHLGDKTIVVDIEGLDEDFQEPELKDITSESNVIDIKE
ncbi:terminase small subunit [Bacillus wiedmannii]|uniref:terminase small subunit n=1 Tax=Bacillus wiedmannii TaxID=1890302 RepID=UPI0001A02672|nr:terminase small subunit [Bacillus wiedmannii]EEK65090.1 Terminase small subunit [Bacillus wiedmannii]MCC2378115.1 terminase small subunit [Bacillus wiedmannii]MCC2423330.1 terminase small subunit [Bacillus wiedmannii]